MSRKSTPEIQRNVLFRLCFWNYERFPQFKPQKVKEIEKWISGDPAANHSEKLTWSDGWLTKDHIEQDTCPYGSPEAHRTKYLSHQFIEKKTYGYTVKKPGQKNRAAYFESVYRLRRDKVTRRWITKIMGQNSFFWLSDYARLEIPQVESELDHAVAHLRLVFGSYLEDGTFTDEPRDKRYLEAIMADLETVKKAIQKLLPNSRIISDSERREGRDVLLAGWLKKEGLM